MARSTQVVEGWLLKVQCYGDDESKEDVSTLYEPASALYFGVRSMNRHYICESHRTLCAVSIRMWFVR